MGYAGKSLLCLVQEFTLPQGVRRPCPGNLHLSQVESKNMQSQKGVCGYAFWCASLVDN